jgi:hypothetical protein
MGAEKSSGEAVAASSPTNPDLAAILIHAKSRSGVGHRLLLQCSCLEKNVLQVKITLFRRPRFLRRVRIAIVDGVALHLEW